VPGWFVESRGIKSSRAPSHPSPSDCPCPPSHRWRSDDQHRCYANYPITAFLRWPLFVNGPRHPPPEEQRRPHDPASRNLRKRKTHPLIATRVSTCQSETSGSSVKLDQSASRFVRCGRIHGNLLLSLGNSGVSQIRNVHRSSRSGPTCQCVASEIDSTEVRIPSPVWSNDLGRMTRTSTGGTNFTHGETGVVWFTGVSISLNAVSGRSAMGMTETKVTAVARRSRKTHLLRLNTRRTPSGRDDISTALGCQGILSTIEGSSYGY
jgi:hypothetical protein